MKKIVLIIAFLTLPLSSYAQDAFYLSGMLGLTNFDTGTNGLDIGTELSYGARFGVLFNDHFSAGLYLHRYAASDTTVAQPLGDIDFSVTNIMAEVTYYFAEADENSFWISGLLGTSKSALDCPSANQCSNANDTSYGASVGYHFMVAPNFSVSPQLTYILVDGEGDGGGQTSGLVNLTVWL